MTQPNSPKSRLMAIAVLAIAVVCVGTVPIVGTIAAVAVLETSDTSSDGALRAQMRRPFWRRADRLERAESERESTPINWQAAVETKGATYRRVPCSTCPSGYRLVPITQPTPQVVSPQPYQVPQHYQTPQPGPHHLTPAELGLPPGSRILSVTERVVRPYQQPYVQPHVQPYQPPYAGLLPHDEVKTGSYTCPRCRHSHLGAEMHSLTTPDGDPVPVLCNHCWGQTSSAQRAEYVRAEMLRQANR